MPKKRNIIGPVCAVIFFICVAAFNLYITFKMKEDSTPQLSQGASVFYAKTALPKTQKQSFVAEDPFRYGIAEQKKYYNAPTQEDWDLNLRKTLAQSRVLNHLEEQGFFTKVSKTPKEFQRQWQRIEERIKSHEKMIRTDPNDYDTQKKLQNLYMLKSTLAVLKDKIVVKSEKR